MNPTLVRSDLRYWRLKPDPRLRPSILCYFIAEAAALQWPEGAQDEQELLIPDGYSEIVFNFQAGYERWPVGESGDRRDELPIMKPSYIIGGRSHSVLTRSLGALKLIGVKLDSRALRSLIGTPLAEFRDSTLTIENLNNRPLLDLEDTLANADSPARVLAILDRFFLHALRDLRFEAPAVGALLRRIHSERGSLSIMKWMRDNRINPRNFERQFCGWTGITPKRYARIVRFNHGYHRLVCRRYTPRMPGEHLDGYYDQSHFDRDFRYFVGAAPRVVTAGLTRAATGITDHLLEGLLESA